MAVLRRIASERHTIDSRAKALLASRAALDKHAEGVVVMDLRALSNVTDFFVVCTADSAPQISAIKDHIEATLARQGCRVFHAEGTAAAPGPRRDRDVPQWVLLDCGDVVVHLLDEPARTFYQLEGLWADAPRVPLDHPEPTSAPAGVPPAHPELGSAGGGEGHPARSRRPR